MSTYKLDNYITLQITAFFWRIKHFQTIFAFH